MQRVSIEAADLRRKLESKGYSTTVKGCCGRTKYRTDYAAQLKLLGLKGSFVVKEHGTIVDIIDKIN